MGAAWWSPNEDGITLQVRVTPGAKRTEFVGVTQDRLRVRIHAPAVEGKANTELIRFLAGSLGVRRSAVTITRGEHTRDKSLRVTGVTEPPTAGCA